MLATLKNMFDKKSYEAAVKNDDKESIGVFVGELFNTFKVPIYRVASSILKSTGLAEDVVQNVFVDILKNPACLVGVNNIAAYLMSAAKHNAVHIKEDLLRGASLESDVESEDPQPDESDYLLRLMDTVLDEEEKVICMLRYGSGLKANEIAKLLGIGANSVYGKAHRGLAKLKKEAKKHVH